MGLVSGSTGIGLKPVSSGADLVLGRAWKLSFRASLRPESVGAVLVMGSVGSLEKLEPAFCWD